MANANEIAGWYQNSLGRTGAAPEIDYWANYAGGADPYAAFLAEANKELLARPKTPATTTGGLMTGEDAVSTGLSGAAGLIGNQTTTPYPTYTPSQTLRPSNEAYPGYSPNQPMAQITTPNYQLNSATPTWNQFNPAAANQYQNVNTQAGVAPWQYQSINPNAQAADWNWQNTQLGMERVQDPYKAYEGTDPAYQKLGSSPTYQGMMGGDYDKLQTALQTPGDIAAQNAFNQGTRNLNNTMGGRGLYGSSIMATQANEGLNREYMNAAATNAANAAAQRYGMQAQDLQNQNQFGLNVYGQQMGENQAANTQGYNTWNTRIGENLSGRGLNLDAAKANQGTYANLQGMNLQQGLAQNNANLDYSRLLTGVNQQNVANALTQNQQMNALGLNYAGMATDANQQNAARALQQATSQNALLSGDTQSTNSLMANQNLAQNSFGQNIYNQQMQQNQNMNTFNQQNAQLGMQQNQNVYNAGVTDAARQQDYSIAARDDRNALNEQTRQWANQQEFEQFQYQLAADQYRQQQDEARINQYLALAGRGAPLQTANQNYLAQQAANNTAAQNGWLSAAGTGVGLMGANNNAGWSALGSGLTSGYNWLMS